MPLHYQEYGDKSSSLMLFLHGGGVGGWMWDKQIQYFSHYHCIVPDLPEHGSNPHETNFSIKGSAVELINLIEEKADGKKVIVVGFSLGSQVLIQMLGMKPDLIDIAIINSALVRPILHSQKWIQTTTRLLFPLVKNRCFSKLQAKTLYVSKDYFEKYYEQSCQMKSDTLVRVLGENMSFEMPEHFGNADAKILVTVGEREKAVMKKSAKDIVEANSNCMGIVISKVGHGAPLAVPELFNRMVETWISEKDLPQECKVIS